MQDRIIKKPIQAEQVKTQSDMIGHILVLNDEKQKVQAYYRPDEGFSFFQAMGDLLVDGVMGLGFMGFIGSLLLPKEPSNLDKAIEIVNEVHKNNEKAGLYNDLSKNKTTKTTDDNTYNGWSNYATWHTNLFYSDNGGNSIDELNYLREELENQEGEANDLLRPYINLEGINWHELEEHIKDDIEYEKKASIEYERKHIENEDDNGNKIINPVKPIKPRMM
jgi:hypothetical protein